MQRQQSWSGGRLAELSSVHVDPGTDGKVRRKSVVTTWGLRWMLLRELQRRLQNRSRGRFEYQCPLQHLLYSVAGVSVLVMGWIFATDVSLRPANFPVVFGNVLTFVLPLLYLVYLSW